MIDTVGFVSKLPHSLVEAFKATLEEVTYADLLLHVVDASYENYGFHIQVTDKVMEEIGAGNKEKILVFNKIDLPHDHIIPEAGRENIEISAKEGTNLDALIEKNRRKDIRGYGRRQIPDSIRQGRPDVLLVRGGGSKGDGLQGKRNLSRSFL